MIKFSFMKIPHLPSSPILLCAGLALSVTQLQAVEFYAESFDDEVAAQVSFNNGAATSYTFVDYSNFTVSSPNPAVTPAAKTIPAAPNTLPGTAATRGLLMQVKYENVVINDPPPNTITATDATTRILNVVAMANKDENLKLNLPANYRVSFDFYLRLSPSITLGATTGIPTNTGTTEQMLWGVHYTSADPMGRSWRSTRGNGMWGWLATEGGHGTTVGADASLYRGTVLAGGRALGKDAAGVDLADVGTYFTPAFGASSSPMPNAPANQWVQAVITKFGSQLTVEYKGTQPGTVLTRFYSNEEVLFEGGSVMVGYEDSFASKSFAELDQWMLLDNLRVEQIDPPTLVVTASTPLVTYTGSEQQGTWLVKNQQAANPLTVSAVTFEGANAGDFSVVTPLPIVVDPGASSPLVVAFNPAAPNGVKNATMNLTSNDPQVPNYTGIKLSARRSVPTFFAAHYKLEEASGTSLLNSATTGNATLTARQAVVFQKTSLIGDPGKSLGLLPAQTSATGNYLVAPVTHSPTFSVSLWIKPESTGVARTLFQRDPDFLGPLDGIYGLILQNDGTLAWRVAGNDVILTNDPLTNGEIYHVVLSHLDDDGFGNGNARRTRLYVNGLLVGSAVDADAKGFEDYPLLPAAGTEGLYIGSRTTAGEGYQGDMDDIQVYGAELSPEQIWNLYRQPGITGLTAQTLSNTNMIYLPPGGAGGANGALQLTFRSNPSIAYVVSSSTDLVEWIPGDPFQGAPNADTTTTTIPLPSPPAQKRFYRIETP
jgi:hypothetical protein